MYSSAAVPACAIFQVSGGSAACRAAATASPRVRYEAITRQLDCSQTHRLYMATLSFDVTGHGANPGRGTGPALPRILEAEPRHRRRREPPMGPALPLACRK